MIKCMQTTCSFSKIATSRNLPITFNLQKQFPDALLGWASWDGLHKQRADLAFNHYADLSLFYLHPWYIFSSLRQAAFFKCHSFSPSISVEQRMQEEENEMFWKGDGLMQHQWQCPSRDQPPWCRLEGQQSSPATSPDFSVLTSRTEQLHECSVWSVGSWRGNKSSRRHMEQF